MKNYGLLNDNSHCPFIRFRVRLIVKKCTSSRCGGNKVLVRPYRGNVKCLSARAFDSRWPKTYELWGHPLNLMQSMHDTR